ncbi:MAG: 16S rRNA (adenine(1518)-N(6)/adenine(1519)-N(6))-dimethyltransferase RsmA [Candidatus Saccharimonadales bacterium]
MSEQPYTKKSLGQHWLNDQSTLEDICDAAALDGADTVLEIGPGPGSLTKLLVQEAEKVIAVEYDERFARALLQAVNADNLEVSHEDILKFDLTKLPKDYKVVANIPYYLTSNLLRVLSESTNPPKTIVLLIQKEVAERVAAKAGDMSLLSVCVQLYYQATLGIKVPAHLFTPPPKVDSQVLILTRHQEPLFKGSPTALLTVVKAGFSARRKTLLNSLSGGLRLDKPVVTDILQQAELNPAMRPQELNLAQWQNLAEAVTKATSLPANT